MKVWQALQQVLLNRELQPAGGICSALYYVVGFEVSGAWRTYRHEAFAEWREFSGELDYPLPGGYEKYHPLRPDRAYYWSGEYGNARKRLLRHLIVWFKERDL